MSPLAGATRSFSFRSASGDQVATYNGPIETMVAAADEISRVLGIPIVVWDRDEKWKGESLAEVKADTFTGGTS